MEPSSLFSAQNRQAQSTISTDFLFLTYNNNTGPQKKESGMNFTCKYTTSMDFERLNPNPVSEFPLDPPVLP